MIESIQFKNFKALRDTTLPLSPCTVIVGPNGSGKTTVLQALAALSDRQGGVSQVFGIAPMSQAPQGFSGSRKYALEEIVSASLRADSEAKVEVRLIFGEPHPGVEWIARWEGRNRAPSFTSGFDDDAGERDASRIRELVSSIRVFSLSADAIAAPVVFQKNMELFPNGAGLAGVLTYLQDRERERFQSVNEELARWLPEFDQILFDFDDSNQRVFLLRTREGHYAIPAADVSQGTLLALALLTLTHLPKPPSLIALEEPDRGIHPRLLRQVQDAIYRLSHPESCGEKRDPVQVIATTHSPYFLDLFKDHPEEVVIANKVGQDVKFERLSEQPRIQEILEDAQLGDIWYTGILGGVPCEP